MNISILANNDLASCVALNQLLPALVGHRLSLFLSSQVGSATGRPRQLEDLKYYEQKLFDEVVFPAQAQRTNETRPELLSFASMSEYLVEPCSELNQINSAEDFARFEASRPDLVISIRYGVILRDPVINLPRFGVLNLHSGLLPDYKGVMATFRAMLNGEKEIGMTLHYIDDASIDTGRIVATTSMAVDSEKSYLAHVLALYKEGINVLVQTIAEIESGGQVACTSQPAGGAYYSFPGEAELAEFESKGLVLVEPEEIATIARKFA